MAKYKIATIPGDGIGPEVMDVTVAVLDAYQEIVDINFEFTKLMAGDEHKA